MRLLILASILCTFKIYAASSTCVINGCNGEVCALKEDTIVTMCLWKAQFECYKLYGICEADAKGVCGWRQTPELTSCIAQAQEEVEKADQYSD